MVCSGVECRPRLRDVRLESRATSAHIEEGMTTGAHSPKKGYRTIRLPLAESEYDRFLTDRSYAKDRLEALYSNNSPLSLVVTMTLFGNMASRVQGDVYFTGVHEIIALTNLPLFITCKDLLS